MRIPLWLLLLVALTVHLTAGAQEWEQVELPDGPGDGRPVLLDIAMDGGVVWFSTLSDAIMGYDGANWVLHTTDDGGIRSNRFRYVMFVDAAGDKWTAKDGSSTIDRLEDGGTFALKDDDTWSYYSYPSQLASKRVFSMVEDADGNKWFGIRDESGTQSSMIELLVENGLGTEDDEWFPFGDSFEPGIFTSEDVRGLELDARERLWIVYDRAGVDVWDYGDYTITDDDTLTHYGATEGLPSDAVRALRSGPDGRMWLGGDNGIAVFEPESGTWTQVAGFPSDRVNDIATDAQGHVWAATDDGVVMLYASGEIAQHYDSSDGLEDDATIMIAVDQTDGTVWAVTEDQSTSETYLNVLESGFGPEARVFVYPNPYREGETAERGVIILGAPEGSNVEVFDITGQSVRELPARREPFRWDSLDADLNEVPSGVYIVRVETPSGEVLFTKVAVIR